MEPYRSTIIILRRRNRSQRRRILRLKLNTLRTALNSPNLGFQRPRILVLVVVVVVVGRFEEYNLTQVTSLTPGMSQISFVARNVVWYTR